MQSPTRMSETFSCLGPEVAGLLLLGLGSAALEPSFPDEVLVSGRNTTTSTETTAQTPHRAIPATAMPRPRSPRCLIWLRAMMPRIRPMRDEQPSNPVMRLATARPLVLPLEG